MPEDTNSAVMDPPTEQAAPITDAPSAPAAPAKPEPTAAERKTEIQSNIDTLTREQRKLERIIKVLEATEDPDASAEEKTASSDAVTESKSDLERTTKRIAALTEQLANVDREEQMKSIAAPFLAKLTKTKIKDSFLLPATVQIVDLEKMEADTKVAAQKQLAMLSLIGALKNASQGLDEEIMANLPTLAITRDGDNNVTFSFASKAPRTRAASTGGRATGGARATSKVRRVETCEVRPDLIGMIVGKADGSDYPSWQAVYEAFADAETRAAMDHQSRNKHDWFCSKFKATTVDLDENGNVVAREE